MIVGMLDHPKKNLYNSKCYTCWLQICHTSGLLIPLQLTLGNTHTHTHTSQHIHFVHITSCTYFIYTHAHLHCIHIQYSYRHIHVLTHASTCDDMVDTTQLHLYTYTAHMTFVHDYTYVSRTHGVHSTANYLAETR